MYIKAKADVTKTVILGTTTLFTPFQFLKATHAELHFFLWNPMLNFTSFFVEHFKKLFSLKFWVSNFRT